MRKKLLAAIMSAAMVACASPVIALAEPVVDTETETTTEGTVDDTEGTDVTEETPVADEALTKVQPLSEPAPVAEPGEDVRTGEIKDQASLEAAIAEGGTVDLGDQTIQLGKTLAVTKDVVIAGGKLVGMSNGTYDRGNLVTLGQGINVTLNGVSITANTANKNALVAWGTNLTVNGLTIDHTKAADGAPIIINNGASATFTGSIDLTLGDKSWYGVNVDRAKADFSAATLNVNGAKGTQSVVCLDNTADQQTVVRGVNLTTVVTKADNGNGTQVAYVADANLPEFVAQKTAVGADIETIALNSDVELSAPLFLKEPMIVNGNGCAFIGTDKLGKENVVTVEKDGVDLSNVTIKTDAANKSALHIYKSSATLTNVTLDNRETAGGAGMVVNAGTAVVNGNLNILLGEKSWGGINIDTSYGNAGVTFADGSHVSVSSTKEDVQDAIYVDEEDKNNVHKVTVEGAEAAGLVQDADGNFVVKEETKPAEDNKPANDNKNDDKKDDKKDGASPKTGDSSALLIALLALAASGAAATVVIRKRNEISR